MTVALISAPQLEPINLAEAKAHLRIDHSHEDPLISSTMTAARYYAETASGQKFITQSWRQYETCMADNRRIALRLRPVQSISAVTIYDQEGNPSILSSNDFELVRGSEPALLQFSSSISTAQAANGVEIDMVVGMGDFGIDVPDTIKRAILMLTAHWYEFRGAVDPRDQPVSIPSGFDALVSPFREMRL